MAEAGFPGDVLGVEWEVLDVRPSSIRRDRGTARLGVTTRNQRGAIVLSLVTTILLPRRPAEEQHQAFFAFRAAALARVTAMG